MGVRTLVSYDGSLTNNVVYANTNQGILVEGSGYYGSVRELVNNTTYQTTGEAIRVQRPAMNAHVRNNILWVEGGVRPTLLGWQSTAFTDGNSVSRDPRFVSPAGADGNTAQASHSPAAVRDHDDRGLAGARFPALNDGLLLRIDDDAASRGWFIDPTPADDAEFFGTVRATVWRRARTARHSTGSTC